MEPKTQLYHKHLISSNKSDLLTNGPVTQISAPVVDKPIFHPKILPEPSCTRRCILQVICANPTKHNLKNDSRRRQVCVCCTEESRVQHDKLSYGKSPRFWRKLQQKKRRYRSWDTLFCLIFLDFFCDEEPILRWQKNSSDVYRGFAAFSRDRGVCFATSPPASRRFTVTGERTEEKLVHCWGDRARNFKTADDPVTGLCVLLRVVYDSGPFFSDF